jgi:hypothetical protein
MPLVFEDLLKGCKQLLWASSCERKRTPGGTKAHADRGFVRPMPTYVSNHHLQAAVWSANEIVEVAAKQRPAAASSVTTGDPRVRACEQRARRKPAFEARNLARLHVCEQQLALSFLGVTPANRIANRTHKLIAIDVALYEIVLGTGLPGGDARSCVVKPCQHDERDPLQPLAKPPNRGKASGVRQREVEQHAVDRRREPPKRVLERAALQNACIWQPFEQLVLHQLRIALIVLYEQHDKPSLGKVLLVLVSMPHRRASPLAHGRPTLRGL